MSIALPQDTSWNAFDNSYDLSAYERICNEFNVDVNADWRQKQSDNQGLGRIHNYWTGGGYHQFDLGVEYDKKRMLLLLMQPAMVLTTLTTFHKVQRLPMHGPHV